MGDQVLVDVWGEVEFRLERVVDRDGTVILPKGGRILCAGRSLATVEADIRRRLAESYSGISINGDEGQIFVSVNLGKLRAIRIFVEGEVLKPGANQLGSLSTIFTALYAVGGPSEAGSYRRIDLLRGGEFVDTLDLYTYLLGGRRQGDLALREGDTVFINSRETALTRVFQLCRCAQKCWRRLTGSKLGKVIEGIVFKDGVEGVRDVVSTHSGWRRGVDSMSGKVTHIHIHQALPA